MKGRPPNQRTTERSGQFGLSISNINRQMKRTANGSPNDILFSNPLSGVLKVEKIQGQKVEPKLRHVVNQFRLNLAPFVSHRTQES